MAANNRRMSGKKGAQVGSGGKRRRGLEGKGPTPPAEMRKGHVKQRAAQAKARRAQGGRPQQ
ncbi:23S rRNA (guanosine(2251)-2'-O)-methyltransferase RlmB, partial [Streptomyces sp. SID9944]|nr:23S rRNA (guanosine(2251)-2'-O)-methyltransferase RlmB [Streptomyces sp. SID9944]